MEDARRVPPAAAIEGRGPAVGERLRELGTAAGVPGRGRGLRALSSLRASSALTSKAMTLTNTVDAATATTHPTLLL